MRALLAAWSTLSALPLPFFRAEEKDLERAANFFPFAGLVLAAIVYGFALLLSPLPGLAASAILVLAQELLCRMFHLDALADTADAFFSSRDRARKLEIMRDSHVGVMGVFAIAGVLLLKFAFLASASDPYWRAAMAAAAVYSSRAALPLYICLTSYARKEGGMGAIWFRRKPYAGVACALGFTAVAGLLPVGALGVIQLRIISAAAVVLVPLTWAFISRRVIGGATGDTIGACAELTETVVLFAIVAAAAFCK